MNWKNSRGKHLVFWRVGSFLSFESDVERLESEGSTNPSKIPRTVWDKGADLLEVQVPEPRVNQPLKKRGLLSHLARIYYPPWIMSPKTVK